MTLPMNIWALLLALALTARNTNISSQLVALIALLATLTMLVFLRAPQAEMRNRTQWLTFSAMVLYLLTFALNPLTSEASFYSEIGAAQVLVLPLAYLACRRHALSAKPALRVRLCGPMMIALLFAAWGVMQGLISHHRAKGTFLDVNSYAALMYVFAIVLASLLLHGTAKRRHWTALAAFLAALAMANSRGAYLAFGVALAVIALSAWRRPRFGLRMLIVGGLVIALYSAANAVPGVGRTYTVAGLISNPTATINGDTISTKSRLWMWQSAWRAYREEGRWLGTGLDTYKLVYPQYRDPREVFSSGDRAHNDYVERLLEGGPLALFALILVGPVGALLLLRKTLLKMPAADRGEAVGLGAGLLALSGHAAVNFIYNDPALNLLAGVFMARLVSILDGAEAGTTPIRSMPTPPWHRSAPVALAGPVAGIYVLLTIREAVILYLLAGPSPPIVSIQASKARQVASFAQTISPHNPYPYNFLSLQSLQMARSEDDPAERNRLLKESYSETMAWLDIDRRATGAWKRLASLAEMDVSATGNTSAKNFLVIALMYDPTDLDTRQRLAWQLAKEGDPEKACRALREGSPWMRIATNIDALRTWGAAGENLCRDFADAKEQEQWKQIANAQWE